MVHSTQYQKWMPVLLAACLSGFPGDCQEKASHYDTDAKTYYSVSTDSQELHVQIMTIEPDQQRKILLNGLELWLDPKGKKNKSTGILFPLQAKTRSNMPGGGDQRNAGGPPPFSPFPGRDTIRPEEKKMLRSLVENNREMKLMNIEQSAGLAVSLRFADDTLIYRADIPFTVFSPALVLNKSLGIGIIEKGMQFPDFGGGEMGGGPGGDGGGPPGGGGGMPEGPPPGGFPGNDDRQKLFSDDKIWFRITLSPDQTAR